MSQFSKPWKELTFSDNYIFCKVMQNEELCKRLIEILLGIEVDKIEYLSTENQIENYYDGRGIRLDVYVKDSNRVFDLEMQTGDYDSLLLRARYYQSASDVAITKRRTKFKNLKESFIVFICVDDPFGQKLPVYTKQTTFLETDKVSYDDKSHIVFYNASAYASVIGNEELKAVLQFVCNNTPVSDYTDKLEASSNEAKSRSEWEDDYMFFQDILEDEKEQAREKGRIQGLKEGHEEGRIQGLKEGHEEGRKEGLKEGLKQGHEEGLKQGINQKALEDAIAFYRNGVSIEIIAKSLNMNIKDVEEIVAQ